MPVYINFVCEHEGCKVLQPVSFEHEHETWGDMIACMRAEGWAVVVNGTSVSCRCKEHAPNRGDNQ